MAKNYFASELCTATGLRLFLIDPARLAGQPILIALDGLRGLFLTIGGLLFVALTALFDYQTGPDLSLSIFYLIPVAICAWWGGFCYGILFSLAGALAWHIVDSLENPLIDPTVGLWNGIARFGTLVIISSLVSRLHASVLREKILARTDPLTGAANGRTFYEMIGLEAARARRVARPLTLAYLDIDNFKQLNDRLGHSAGDDALRQVVQVIRPHLRCADLLARLGGDEFALLLPDTDVEGARAILARLRDYLGEEMGRSNLPVTLSIGAIAFERPVWDVDLMIQHVDALMYTAKRNGRNRIELTSIPESQSEFSGPNPWIERRATTRALCNRSARVRPEMENNEGPEDFATVHDISAVGVRLSMDKCFARDTILVIEPLVPGVKALLARVVYVAPEDGRWAHGCQLSLPLNDGELHGWVGELLEPSPR